MLYIIIYTCIYIGKYHPAYSCLPGEEVWVFCHRLFVTYNVADPAKTRLYSNMTHIWFGSQVSGILLLVILPQHAITMFRMCRRHRIIPIVSRVRYRTVVCSQGGVCKPRSLSNIFPRSKLKVCNMSDLTRSWSFVVKSNKFNITP